MDNKRKPFGSQGPPKKVFKKKTDDDEEFERSNFEEELALMDDFEAELQAESVESEELIGNSCFLCSLNIHFFVLYI